MGLEEKPTTNISHEKNAESARLESERKYRQTLENIPMAAVSLDLNGRITFVNELK